jgi:hypothetical protein
MKDYICKEDFYVNDAIFASKGDNVALLQDNTTVVNKRTNAAISLPKIVNDTKYFIPTFETFVNNEDRVNHPNHYTWLKEKCGIEVIDITRHLSFDRGNAIKYLLRAGYKKEEGISFNQKEIEDLRKAMWYIQDEINHLEYTD